MARNPHKPGVSAANSFSRAEIDALDTILAILRRGGDARVVARSDAARSAAAKFAAERERVGRPR